LRLSKTTVSKAISRIEAPLGARLIIRTARRFELTDAGRQLVSRAAFPEISRFAFERRDERFARRKLRRSDLGRRAARRFVCCSAIM
jgi:hypothetical protein